MAIICTTPLAVFNANYCAPTFLFGPVDKIFWTKAGDGLTLVTDLAEWNTRLSNTTPLPGSGLAPIRYADVKGSIGEPEQTTTEASRGRDAISQPKYILPFEIDDLPADLVTWANSLQQKSYVYTFWFEAGGQIFGGNSGFQATLTAKGFTIPEARTDLHKLTGQVAWYGAFPARAASPFV